MLSNYEKARYHLDRAEQWQARVEAYEAEAEAKAAVQQAGRMGRKDGTVIDVTFLAKNLLENPGYRRACGIRDSHQKQALLYATLYAAAIPDTGNHLVEGKVITPEMLDRKAQAIPRQRST